MALGVTLNSSTYAAVGIYFNNNTSDKILFTLDARHCVGIPPGAQAFNVKAQEAKHLLLTNAGCSTPDNQISWTFSSTVNNTPLQMGKINVQNGHTSQGWITLTEAGNERINPGTACNRRFSDDFDEGDCAFNLYSK